MNNKVYYGEYSLKHWIDLLLQKNIVLPDYQRIFVWDKDKVIKLLKSIDCNYFIPPITIGAYRQENGSHNLIIDGQQRLTSLLLSCLQLYPKGECFKPKSEDVVSFADENDDERDDENDDNILGWTFNELLKKGNSLEIIKRNIVSDSIEKEKYDILDYSKQNINITDDFLENHYLGFSYLIPNENQQQYFSSVFRDINAEGKKLSALETRRSLYFLSNGLEDFFDPKCIRNISIKKDDGIERVDFVRCLSFVFQYAKDNSSCNVAKKYGRKLEEYYETFIYFVINKDSDSVFFEFKNEHRERINNLENDIENLSIDRKQFPSVIDADLYMFGLIYYVILEGKEIDVSKKDLLCNSLDTKISSLKNDPEMGWLHRKTPSALKYLRLRMDESIDIYRDFVK